MSRTTYIDLLDGAARQFTGFIDSTHVRQLTELFDSTSYNTEKSYRPPPTDKSDSFDTDIALSRINGSGEFEYYYEVVRTHQLMDEHAFVKIDAALRQTQMLSAVSEWAGCTVSNVRYVGITAYDTDSYLGPHTDSSNDRWGRKVVAFNLSLETPTKERNGVGDLVYLIAEEPSHITFVKGGLTLFKIDELGVHFVPPPIEGRRVSLVGFYYA